MADRICILRLSAIGDCTHVVPVALALRDAGHEVTWVIGRLEHKLVSGIPGIRFVVFDKKQGTGAYRKLRRTLSGETFDTLLVMQLSARAAVASLCIRARRRVGYDRSRSRELHGLVVNERISKSDDVHVLDVFRAFGRQAGLDDVPIRWNFHLDAADQEFAEENLPGPGTRILCISPCSSHARRNWMPDRYAAVADHAIAAGWEVVLSGGPSDFEREFASRIQQKASHPVIDLTGRDTLRQLAAVMGRSDCVLAPDTGPVHIANAMGTTTIGLYAATDPARSGPYGQLPMCVNRYADAARKFRKRPPENLRWGSKIEEPGVMELITVDDVLEKFRAL